MTRLELEERVFQGALRVADHLLAGEVAVLRAADLTFAQYNVLRILRGGPAEGLPCGEVSARMITRDSDITRLCDRLAERGLCERVRAAADRRVVLARITPAGRKLLKGLDEPVRRVHRERLAHLTTSERRTLAALLERVPTPAGAARETTTP